MKLIVPCMSCFDKSGTPDETFYRAEVLDHGVVNFRCRYGHQSVNVLQNLKFEILAELAAMAIHDGYYREAVTSFTSSLERFHECYIKTVVQSRDIDSGVLDTLWKSVKRQSERQLGAYTFVYALEENKVPPSLSSNKIEFRNKVIHQGLIPSRAEAIKYGQAVLDVINPALGKLLLKTEQKNLLDRQTFELVRTGYEIARSERAQPSTSSGALTLLEWRRERSDGFETVEGWLARAQERSDRLSQAKPSG